MNLNSVAGFGAPVLTYRIPVPAKYALSVLSAALLVGLGLNYLYGFWQADPLVGLLIVIYLIKEGHSTLTEED